METLATVTGILVLAALAEALVEYLFSPIIKAGKENDMQPEPAANQPLAGLDWRVLAFRYTSAGVGVCLCIIYETDLFQYFGLYPPWPWIGWVITGLLIGRGSNFVHDFASTWLKPQ
jgi:hypothetical protein